LILLGDMGLNGLVSSYKAKFEPNPNAMGYLYYKDDRGHGVPCSREQYDDYIEAYGASLNRLQKVMWRWAFFYFFLIAIFFLFIGLKFNHLYPYLESSEAIGILGAIFMLPFGYLLWKSWQERNRPNNELFETHGASLPYSGKQRGGMVLFNQRLKAIATLPLLFGLSVGFVGLIVSLQAFLDDGTVSEYLGMFILLIMFFSFVLWRRHCAFQADRRILAMQDATQVTAEAQADEWVTVPPLNLAAAQQIWLRLNDLVVHSCDKNVVKEKILAVEVSDDLLNEIGEIDPLSYYYLIVEEALDNTTEEMFVLFVDWKEAANDYFWKLTVATAGTVQLNLPTIEDTFASIHEVHAFSTATVELNKHGLMQFLIEDGSDSYHFIVVKHDDQYEVEQALQELQLEYSFFS